MNKIERIKTLYNRFQIFKVWSYVSKVGFLSSKLEKFCSSKLGSPEVFKIWRGGGGPENSKKNIQPIP